MTISNTGITNNLLFIFYFVILTHRDISHWSDQDPAAGAGSVTVHRGAIQRHVPRPLQDRQGGGHPSALLWVRNRIYLPFIFMGDKFWSERFPTSSSPASENVINEHDCAPKDFSCAAETSLLRHNQDRNLQFSEEAVRQPPRRWALIIALCFCVILCLQEWCYRFSLMFSSKFGVFVLKAASQWKGFKSFRVEQQTLICSPLLCFYTFSVAPLEPMGNMLILQTDAC